MPLIRWIARLFGGGKPSRPMSKRTFDERSEKNLKTLNPKVEAVAREWLGKCLDEGINVKIICGTRTMREQEALYELGRTKPGRKVTNARPGHSWHNFGLAWDFVVYDSSGQPLWRSPEMTRCGEIAESLGMEWGGRWTKFVDIPHIQYPAGITMAEARSRWNAGIAILA